MFPFFNNKAKKTDNPKTARKSTKDPGKDFFSNLTTWIQLSLFILLLVDIYMIASLFSLWTGKWGTEIKDLILATSGGSILVILVYFAYIAIAFLLRKKIPRFLREVTGTLVLFTCYSLLLGLLSISGSLSQVEILRPGIFGTRIAVFLFRNLGALGTTLTGLILVLITAMLYGFVKFNAILNAFIETGVNLFKILFGKVRPTETHQTEDTVSGAEDGRLLKGDNQNGKAILGRNREFNFGNGPVIRKDQMESIQEEDGYTLSTQSEQKDIEEPLTEEKNPARLDVEPGHFPPPLELFGPDDLASFDIDENSIRIQGEQIISTLNDFGIEADLAETVIGPTVIQFQLQLAPGIKVSRVAGLSNDLAVSLAVPALRVEAPIPFKPYVGIEIPNPRRIPVPVRTMLGSREFINSTSQLPIPVGLRVNSEPLVINLEDLPHLLVAGTTGSGKSVFITSCITCLCSKRNPDELRMLLIDPKRVELNIYENLPHVLAKPVVDPRKAVHALGWAVREMEHRYEMFARSRVRNIASYNSKVLPKDKLPHIVIIVDELADLMFTAQKDVEDFICRLAQMARATGIHLIIATQRPSVNVITGLIKANIPARVAFTLPSQADSRTIIDLSGAEKLLGRGDMLFVSSKYPRPVRVQAPFMDENQSLNFINYIKDLFGPPEYVDLEDQGDTNSARNGTSFLDDPLLEEAIDLILETGIASASRLQRQLRIGFTRAARIIDTLEQMGIVGPQEGSKPREILVDEERASEIFEENIS
ncbi:MAG: DNA translocase FtsK 4TM domain-containing protein [Synergistales bacterium]|nr:DNA translocase FtsK 4TM domain-containing protein [Synergistales bacterium]